MQEFGEYLAINVLNEGQTVSYRTLSRALKVHTNLAKQMLFDFHQKENKKEHNTVHATYLVTGRQRLQGSAQTNGNRSQESQDTHMRSSPFPSSSAQEPQHIEEENRWRRLVTLAREEDLEDARTRLDELISVHVYSLEPSTIKDLQTLTDCNQRLVADHANEDPLQAWKQYGTIQNEHVQRRTARKPPPAAASAVTTSKVPIKATAPAKPPVNKTSAAKETKATPKVESPAPVAKAESEGEVNTAVSSQAEGASKPATLKRERSSIFKSFAKSKPPAPKKDAESPAAPSPMPEPESPEPANTLSDDEADGDSMMLDEDSAKEPSGKSKRDRETELRDMMDVEDEPMEDAPSNPIDTAPETPDTAPDNSQAMSEPAETVTVTNGRRRGKRRVMKKKTFQDKEGYFVTKEEAAWESFSEEEPAPKKTKTTFAPAAPSKAKKGGKPGQGNIMSFFGKK